LVSSLGEPFLNTNFWEIVSAIKKRGVAVGYTTNGLLLNNENIQKTLEKNADVVVVSIESLNKNIYEKIRPGSNIDEVINNLKNLIKAKKEKGRNIPEVRLGFTIQKNNIEELPEIVKFAHVIGVNMVYFTNLISHTPEMVTESPHLLDKAYVKKIFNDTENIAHKLKIKIRLPKIDIKKEDDCYYVKNTLFVDYQGRVFCNSCCRFPQKQYFTVEGGKIIQKELEAPLNLLGDINNEPILKIWNNKNYIKLRKRLASKDCDYPCKNCYFKYEIH
jgi:MoaA/NifB/PqqE/SkfB family radical SAM enzyme